MPNPPLVVNAKKGIRRLRAMGRDQPAKASAMIRRGGRRWRIVRSERRRSKSGARVSDANMRRGRESISEMEELFSVSGGRP